MTGGDTRVDGRVRFVGHATVRLDVAGHAILTDPFLRSRLGLLERHGVAPDLAIAEGLDVVLVSHGHPDHLDPASLGAIAGRPVFLVPRGLGGIVARAVRGEVVEVVAGERVVVGGLAVDAVPARHWISPGAPRAEPIGYVLDAGARIYFAGDTGKFPGMAPAVGRVDLALLPVWTWGPHLGPGHLGPRSAAEVLAELRASSAIPIHWGTLYPRRLHRVLGRPLREPGPRFADHASRLAPSTEVRVLAPGGETLIALAPTAGVVESP